MIRALLLRSGVADLPVRQVYSARGRRWLATVALPPEAATTLQRLVRVLNTLHAEATEAEAVDVARAEVDRSRGRSIRWSGSARYSG